MKLPLALLAISQKKLTLTREIKLLKEKERRSTRQCSGIAMSTFLRAGVHTLTESRGSFTVSPFQGLPGFVLVYWLLGRLVFGWSWFFLAGFPCSSLMHKNVIVSMTATIVTMSAAQEAKKNTVEKYTCND